MKKLIAMLMVLAMVLSFAACANNNDTQDDQNDNVNTNENVDNNEPENNEGDTNEGDTNEPENNEGDTNEPVATDDALTILNNIWAQYGEDEKFPIMGGNPEGGAMEPAVWAAEFMENLTYTTNIPAEQLANVADAATMIHMMNANTFTGAVYHLNEGVDAAAFAQAVRDAIQSAQWMCGFPEKLIVAVIGDCVLVAYGVNDAMNPFEGHLAAAYADAEILFNEAIAG